MNKLLLFLLTFIGIANVLLLIVVLINQKIIKKGVFMNQQRIDDLTAQLNAGTDNIITTVQAEAEQVRQAIADNTLDTTQLEAAIQRSAELSQIVEGIYTAPSPTEETATEPAETEDVATDTDTVDTDTDTLPTDTVDDGVTETEETADVETEIIEPADEPFNSER